MLVVHLVLLIAEDRGFLQLLHNCTHPLNIHVSWHMSASKSIMPDIDTFDVEEDSQDDIMDTILTHLFWITTLVIALLIDSWKLSCFFLCVCLGVCVCVREREREREICVCVCVCRLHINTAKTFVRKIVQVHIQLYNSWSTQSRGLPIRTPRFTSRLSKHTAFTNTVISMSVACIAALPNQAEMCQDDAAISSAPLTRDVR